MYVFNTMEYSIVYTCISRYTVEPTQSKPPPSIRWFTGVLITWHADSTPYSVHYNVQCTLYAVQCTLYNVHCTQCTVYNVHYTLYITLYSVQCTLYIVA